MDLQEQLTQTFATNFVAYYRSHAAHVNIRGRNFYSDHELLGKIYEDLQENIDSLAELLRTIEADMPVSISEVLITSVIDDSGISGSDRDLLEQVYDDLETLIDEHRELYAAAEEEQALDISNYAQDRIQALKKSCWMLRSTLEGRYEDDN
jgi:starvation-inducible DNA-binding protein